VFMGKDEPMFGSPAKGPERGDERHLALHRPPS